MLVPVFCHRTIHKYTSGVIAPNDLKDIFTAGTIPRKGNILFQQSKKIFRSWRTFSCSCKHV